MCNQAAGLSHCLTRVQDAMSSQLKSLHLDSSKGKSSDRMRQAIDELDYLVTFNRSISQAMARTIQDLSEDVFISMANFTLARRDSYLEYLHTGVKQDTLTALRTAPVHLLSLFHDQLITKAEEEICRSEERHSHSSSHRRQGRFHPYAPSDRSDNQLDRKSGNPAWKQIRVSNNPRKVVASLQPSPRNRLRVPSRVNDNHCVTFMTGLKDSVYVSGQIGLNPSPVIAGDKKVTRFSCRLLCCKCSFCYWVAAKERRKSQLLLQVHRNKICERCFLCRSFEFCKYCHKCPTCCYKSTCRGKATQFLGELGSSGFKSKK